MIVETTFGYTNAPVNFTLGLQDMGLFYPLAAKISANGSKQTCK
jgi:hypothetical protein